MNQPSQPSPARNILLRLAYDGTDFFGWQIQPDRPTIEGTVAAMVEKISGEKVRLCGSGRTDAGVHACAQAANVKLHSPIPCPNLVKALNRVLPDSIRVLSAQPVADDFHARHHAVSKFYKYRMYRAEICPPWLSRYVLPYAYPLDETAMHEAAACFQGTHDFRSFAAADQDDSEIEEDEEKSCVRTISSSELRREGEELIYTVQGNGFLRHMVRNIVGTLIEVGRGRMAVASIPQIIAACQRSAAGPTAPARGLHLVSAGYKPEALNAGSFI
ncbi:MAG: tRNA pseudouridine(38-40) synthase TruA [Acidobacteria bacterium]|nr:tRNA pseudouridine(38-40) synthase TruA [Acidobacteriota bacterium]